MEAAPWFIQQHRISFLDFVASYKKRHDDDKVQFEEIWTSRWAHLRRFLVEPKNKHTKPVMRDIFSDSKDLKKYEEKLNNLWCRGGMLNSTKNFSVKG